MNSALRSIHIILSGLALIAASGAQAALVNFTLTGTVTSTETYCGTDDDYNDIYCNRPNTFGLVAGDEVIVSGVYDDAHLTGSGNEVVSFGIDSDNSLSMTLGSYVFTQASDDWHEDAAPGHPLLMLSDGGFAALSIYISGGVLWYGVFESYGMNFYAVGNPLDPYNSSGYDWELFGAWNSFTATAIVPVPAAVWLFASGLLGLMAASRRKTDR